VLHLWGEHPIRAEDRRLYLDQDEADDTPEERRSRKHGRFNAALCAELRGRVHTVRAHRNPSNGRFTWTALVRELAPNLTHVHCDEFELEDPAKVTNALRI
jgi:hypothetical protein